jgi:hypothetical protein
VQEDAARPRHRHAEVVDALRGAILGPAGRSPADARRLAYDGRTTSEPLATYLSKVRDASYRITDADIAALRAAGLDEDSIFELTVAAALGSAGERLDAGIRALRASR